ncbi:hypothetical protein ACAG26_05195 [Mycobacterium sp. pUA109]|uniref:hypothetical protein n=1 Tax=Mycobacterium sp. pUA109 TaxID=3238982 RepID=UPI00351B81DC
MKVLGAYVRGPDGVLQALSSLSLAARQLKLTSQDIEESLRSVATEQQPVVEVAGLVGSPTIRTFAKALELRNAYEKILINSRIISDIRPVFADDEDDVGGIVESAMVNHTLQLTYQPGDSRWPAELHLALDTADLKKLKRQIDRALEKGGAARALIEKGGAAVLEPQEQSE